MKSKFLGNFHWIFFLMAAMNLFDLYEISDEKIENTKMSIEGLESKKIQQDRKLKQITRFKENLSQSKERVLEVVKQIEKVQKQLPTNVNDTEVASKVTAVAEELKFREVGITPMAEVASGFYFTKNYNFQGEGTFLQSIILFENLQKTERILNIKDFEIKQIDEKLRGKFKVLNVAIGIESYRYNNSYKEKSGVEEIENEFKVP